MNLHTPSQPLFDQCLNVVRKELDACYRYNSELVDAVLEMHPGCMDVFCSSPPVVIEAESRLDGDPKARELATHNIAEVFIVRYKNLQHCTVFFHKNDSSRLSDVAIDLIEDYSPQSIRRSILGTYVYDARKAYDKEKADLATEKALKDPRIRKGSTIKGLRIGCDRYSSAFITDITDDGFVSLHLTKRGSRNRWTSGMTAGVLLARIESSNSLAVELN